jgi:hypothetical protein
LALAVMALAMAALAMANVTAVVPDCSVVREARAVVALAAMMGLEPLH